MILRHHLLGAIALMAFAAASCATGGAVGPNPQGDGGPSNGDSAPPASCDGPCDQDHDGVPDGTDQCPNTPANTKVNKVGCADAQLTPKLADFPPYGLTWTPTGDLGRAGGLTWTYTGIQRADLFHIYWIVCDDPATPCGLSLDGPIDTPAEKWAFSATDSNLPAGKLVFTNTTGILLADSSTLPLSGRLTLTIVGENNTVIPFTDVATLGVTPRDGKYGAEILGTGFTVVALAEVKDNVTSTWTPYLDYYDAASTPDNDAGADAGGGNVYVSYGGSFYGK